ncbi:MAG: class I SAM-dependent methyltransferase [Actinomycetota bacterium]|nr:class I SAM-dependent methyltransferase [Actinomycetota bacterium]
MSSVRELEARYYRNSIDDHAVFDATVRRYLSPGARVLDAGAGRGIHNPYDYARLVDRLVGVDLDPEVRANANVHSAVVADLADLPFADHSFDLVFSKYVFEHLRRPAVTLRELRRVLRPGGHLVFHTPNRYHYVALGATLTPQRFHVWFNERRGRAAADSFPTAYRINDRRTISGLAGRAGFGVDRLDLIEPKPDYLTFHPVAYRAGVAYERLVNRWDVLRDLRCVIVGDLVAS